MRTAGGYTLQQSLTSEAANIAKQAVSLARRRGHAQVTPLHVATIMFSTSSTCLFRKACLQSHSHPLQSRALELCFNVALNRLQTSTSNSILVPHHPHHHLPSLSNALIAAFKRAQAHQRRGSAENQQPVLAVKIDIEQLVISILDDPSVSRVMREAGFSSTQVKTKVESATSHDVRTSTPHTVQCPNPNPLILGNSCVSSTNDFKFSIIKSADKPTRNDDVMSVIETLTNKKTRNIVIVGECAITAENVVKGVIEKFDSGNVYQEMQSLQFISVPLYSLRSITREDFEAKLKELRSLVKSLVSRGVVLYLGDLKWACDQRMFSGGGVGSYSAVEHMVMELSRLGRGYGGYNGKLWIMGTATFQTYMKCKNGNPSLEKLWELHAITIPVGCLALGLNLESDLNSNIVKSKEAAGGSSNWLLGKERTELNFNKAGNIVRSPKECDSTNTNYTNSSLPAWLQKYKEDEIKENTHDQENVMINNLGSNPNSTLNFSSASPCSSTSISSNDSKKNLQNFLNWESNFEDIHSIKEQNFLMDEPKLENKPDLLSNPNSSPNSASSSEASGEIPFLPSRFTEHNQENFDFLSTALEKVVPWQRDAIQETVNTVLKCRSKMKKQDTWIHFTGPDSEGKETIAKELAKVVFGSQDNVITISLSSFSTVDSGAGEEVISKKRSRNEEGRSYFEGFKDKVKENPSRVFFIEDVEQIDYSSEKGFKKAMDSGSFRLEEDGELFFLKDAIVIFSSDNISSCLSRASPAPAINVNDGDRLRKSQNCEKVEEIKNSGCALDLNVAMDECNEDAGFLCFVDNIVVFKV